MNDKKKRHDDGCNGVFQQNHHFMIVDLTPPVRTASTKTDIRIVCSQCGEIRPIK